MYPFDSPDESRHSLPAAAPPAGEIPEGKLLANRIFPLATLSSGPPRWTHLEPAEVFVSPEPVVKPWASASGQVGQSDAAPRCGKEQ